MNIQTYTICPDQAEKLIYVLSNISFSPYDSYKKFRDEVKKIISEVPYLLTTIQFIQSLGRRFSSGDLPCFLLKNCPIDQHIILKVSDVYRDNWTKKKTFIAEGFLEFFSQCMGTPLLAYETRNGGDFFQNIIPENKYFETQTQKTNGELYFHNDRTAHLIRADYIYLLSINIPKENSVITEYIPSDNILSQLSDNTVMVLRDYRYVTPFDRLSNDSHSSQIISPKHPVIEGDRELRFYSNRTTICNSTDREATNALSKFQVALKSACKYQIKLNDGDMLVLPNKLGLHARTLAKVANYNKLAERWLLKTYNFRSEQILHCHASDMVEYGLGLVKEEV